MNSSIDFDQLAKAAFPEVNQLGEVEDLDRLWQSLFDLDKWFFLAKQNLIDAEPVPYRWDRKQDGQLWFLVFTDENRAIRFASKQGLANESEKVPFVAMTPEAARLHTAQAAAASSVFGVRFNEGSQFGWAAPAEDIQAIYAHLTRTDDKA